MKLGSIRVNYLTKSKAEKVIYIERLTEGLKKVEQQNIDDVIKQLEDLPTIDWSFGEAGTTGGKDLNDCLTVFVKSIATTMQEQNPHKILDIVEKGVLDVNNVSGLNPGVIETSEREQIAGFINDTVELIGVKSDSGHDLTAEWRQW